MRHVLSGILLILLGQISVASETTDGPVDAIQGVATSKGVDTNLAFKVFLNDREVGSHTYRLQQQGESLLVSSTMNLDFTILRVKKIKYRHQADEVWQGGCLVSLTSRTEKQGRNTTVDALTNASGLTVVHSEGTAIIEGCAKGFAYWNPALLEANFLLNAESGEYVPVDISATHSSEDNITHMLIDSPQVDVHLQYDAAGHWLSLESELQFGGLIRYQRTAINEQTRGQ